MFIYVNKNCLSAHGKIFRRGAVVEVDDEAGTALLGSDDFSICEMDPSQQETIDQKGKDTKEKSVKRTKEKKTVNEPEEELPIPNLEEAVEK